MIHNELPELAIVRVRSAGGPYNEGDMLSIAFAAPAICRIVRHGEPLEASHVGPDSRAADPPVPDTIAASIVVPAGPYAAGDAVTLSFVDPRIARVHSAALAAARSPENQHAFSATPGCPVPTRGPTSDGWRGTAGDPRPAAHIAADSNADADAESTLDDEHAAGVAPNADTKRYTDAYAGADSERRRRRPMIAARTRLAWPSDRALRFVQVCDRLFTVERLGWYRHALVMRLLLPDEIVGGDGAANSDLADDLQVLNASALETLGRPMLAAFMPNFSVTSEWLDSLDSADAARALSRLRSTLTTKAPLQTIASSTAVDTGWTEGSVALHELESASETSAEALLPLLIANVSPIAPVTEKLTAYRDALIELFGQTAGSAEVVRLSQMTLPNHILDDRLWQLVGVISDTFVAQRNPAV